MQAQTVCNKSRDKLNSPPNGCFKVFLDGLSHAVHLCRFGLHCLLPLLCLTPALVEAQSCLFFFAGPSYTYSLGTAAPLLLCAQPQLFFCGGHRHTSSSVVGTDLHLFFFAGLQKIDAEEQAIYEEMLSAAGMVEEEARQRFRKLREAKEVTQLWCSEHSMPLLHSGLVLHLV